MPIFQYFRRRWLLRKPFPGRREEILKYKVPYYQRLPTRYQDMLKDRITIFLDEKLFEGCGGLQLTEEMKVIVAAYACLLILEVPSDYYPDLQSILIYPDDYMAPVYEEDAAGVVTQGTEPRKGESWDTGNIILSWQDITDSIYDEENHQNLIIHEFSHQLDQRYGLSAGIDERGDVIRDDEWNRTFAKAYRDHRWKMERGRKSTLDEYGAVDPAEFFAVASEAFFEDPKNLRVEYSAIYKLLASFYNIDPYSDFR